MTAPNWFGWIDTRAAMRNQKQLALHYAAEVGNEIGEYDATLLAMALDACQTNPAHKRNGQEAKRQAAEVEADNEWLQTATAEHADLTPKIVDGVSSPEWWDAVDERSL